MRHTYILTPSTKDLHVSYGQLSQYQHNHLLIKTWFHRADPIIFSFEKMSHTLGAGEEKTTAFYNSAYIYLIPIIVILVVGIAATISYFYNCLRSASLPPQRSANPQGNPSLAVETGLDETVLQSYPARLYSIAKIDNKDTPYCCSICLCDYKNSDMLRLLPDCQHIFHQKCVDPWLRLHPTCPVCRNTPLSTPLSTQVVPSGQLRV